MRIGVPREIKDREFRAGLTPGGAAALAGAGHRVRIESGAGTGSGFMDAEYAAAGAEIVDAGGAWDADLVIKVKEPLETEYRFLAGQMLFTYLHLAGSPADLTQALLDSGTTAIAYETVEDEHGHLPLLAPMSAVAGNVAVTVGNYYLARFNGGRGVLLGSVLGRGHGTVFVVGDGVVGRHAGRVATAMGARVIMAGRHADRVPDLRRELSGDLEFVLSEPGNIAAAAAESDLVIGAVLVRGARAPHVLTREMVAAMHAGSVIVDVSIDQGGCVETSHPTTHGDPVFTVHGVIHYCVTNMPGAWPRTATIALTDATLPCAVRIANLGLAALRDDPGLARGVNTFGGHIVSRAVAEALDRPQDYRDFGELCN